MRSERGTEGISHLEAVQLCMVSIYLLQAEFILQAQLYPDLAYVM